MSNEVEVYERLAQIGEAQKYSAFFGANTEQALQLEHSGNSIFASRIICGDCGSFYGAKTWHSTSKYRKIIYRCFNKYADKDHKCETPTLNESDIKDAFIAVFNILMADKEGR